MNYSKLSALEIAAAIKNGKTSVTDVAKFFLNQKDTVNAFVSYNPDLLKEAEEVQKRINSNNIKSALAGIPIAVKDNICTKGIQTSCASKMLEDFVPPYNATVIEKIKKADLLVLGKTNMDEFAMGSTSETSFYNSVLNPYDKNRVAGGSSGGSAAAVSCGLAPIALGSDTGGSVRQPSSYCGVYGLKATYGAISRYGLIPYASSFDTIGIIGKSADDLSELFNIIKGKDEKDSTSIETSSLESKKTNLNCLTIGVPVELIEQNAGKDVLCEFNKAIEWLQESGAEVKAISFTEAEHIVPAYYIIASAEASSNLAKFDGIRYGFRANGKTPEEVFVNSRSKAFGKEVKKRIMLGNFVLSSGYYDEYYLKALKAKNTVVRSVNNAFDCCDLIITPTAPTVAPLLATSLKNPLNMYKSDVFTLLANLCGIPAISIPYGKNEKGLPIGLQVMGKACAENKIINFCNAFKGIINNEL